MDFDIDADRVQGAKHVAVEVGAGGSPAKLHDALLAVTGGDQQALVEEVEGTRPESRQVERSESSSPGWGSGARAGQRLTRAFPSQMLQTCSSSAGMA
jgi:hypothetical protein